MFSIIISSSILSGIRIRIISIISSIISISSISRISIIINIS